MLILKYYLKFLCGVLREFCPPFIYTDQTGFITGRNSCNNMRRLLNVIQLSHQLLSSMIISLDAEKAFDRVEWHFLFYTLNAFGLGDAFSSWVKLLYNRPLAAVGSKASSHPTFLWSGEPGRDGLYPLVVCYSPQSSPLQ